MKKLMSVMLGLSLLLGAATVSFAAGGKNGKKMTKEQKKQQRKAKKAARASNPAK